MCIGSLHCWDKIRGIFWDFHVFICVQRDTSSFHLPPRLFFHISPVDLDVTYFQECFFFKVSTNAFICMFIFLMISKKLGRDPLEADPLFGCATWRCPFSDKVLKIMVDDWNRENCYGRAEWRCPFSDKLLKIRVDDWDGKNC